MKLSLRFKVRGCIFWNAKCLDFDHVRAIFAGSSSPARPGDISESEYMKYCGPRLSGSAASGKETQVKILLAYPGRASESFRVTVTRTAARASHWPGHRRGTGVIVTQPESP
jgi:hypothetical protein